jgi:hypothetical protein
MSNKLSILPGTAASIGFLDTLRSRDHYISFVAMVHAKKWSMP